MIPLNLSVFPKLSTPRIWGFRIGKHVIPGDHHHSPKIIGSSKTNTPTETRWKKQKRQAWLDDDLRIIWGLKVHKNHCNRNFPRKNVEWHCLRSLSIGLICLWWRNLPFPLVLTIHVIQVPQICLLVKAGKKVHIHTYSYKNGDLQSTSTQNYHNPSKMVISYIFKPESVNKKSPQTNPSLEHFKLCGFVLKFPPVTGEDVPTNRTINI